MMKSNPVGWFEIYVDDMERAKAFYETVLDGELTQLEMPEEGLEMLAFPMDMESSGASGALVKMDGISAGGNSTIIYFACEDCGVEALRVESAGGQVEKPKMSIGEFGFMVMALDTEGNVFGLHSMK